MPQVTKQITVSQQVSVDISNPNMETKRMSFAESVEFFDDRL